MVPGGPGRIGWDMKRRTFLISAGAFLAAGRGRASPPPATSTPAIPIGLLLPLSGPDADWGAGLRDTALMAVDEVNRSGRRHRLAVRVLDGAGDRRAFCRALDQLTGEARTASIFGLCPADLRSDMLRLVEERQSLFWDPAPTPGGECSGYVIHGGPTPQQSLKNLIPWLAEQVGNRFLLVGTDLPWPAELVRVAREMAEEIHAELVAPPRLLPPGHSDFSAELEPARRGDADVLLAALTGPSLAAFLRQYHAAGIDPLACPVASPTVTEREVAAAGPTVAAGAIAAAPYFADWQSPANRLFLQRLRRFTPRHCIPNAPAEAIWTQIHLFAAALDRLGSADVTPLTVREAARDCQVSAPEGIVRIDGATLHSLLWPKIAVVEPSGWFRVLERTVAPVPPLPFWAWPGKSCSPAGLVMR